MAVVAEYCARLTGDITPLKASIAEAKQLLASLGQGVPTNIDAFLDKTSRSIAGITPVAANASQALLSMGAAGQKASAEIEKVGYSAATSFGTFRTGTQSSLQEINNWGDGVSTSIRKFRSDIEAVPQSFAPIAPAAQSIGQAVTASTGVAASSLGQMSQAATVAATSFTPIGVNVQEAGAKILALRMCRGMMCRVLSKR